MKLVQIIFSAAALALVLVATTAFIDLRQEKKIKQMQSPSAENGFAVVELFTSEGCSSCPPADELMEKIQKENRNDHIYILAFHVDYWDHQGWKDRFSDHAFSQRQQQYASWMGLRTIYTPQVIVNGSEEVVGSEQGKVLQAITDELGKKRNTALTLHTTIKDGKVLVGFDGIKKNDGASLVLALVQRSGLSQVKGGENAGKALSHVQVVRKLEQIEIGGEEKTASLSLPADFDKESWELVGFVQRIQDGHVLDAARVAF